MSDNMYMKICFYDNDFGLCVREATARLWKYIFDNNNHLLEDYSIENIFEYLNEKGYLINFIKTLVDLEYIAQEIEFHTRGLYRKDRNIKIENRSKELDSVTNRYLSIDLSFLNESDYNHKNHKWENGEVIYLNLKTGEIIET